MDCDNYIVFILNRGFGSSIIRGNHIIDKLKVTNNRIKFYYLDDCKLLAKISTYKNSIFLWIKDISRLEEGCLLTKQNNNINIYDMVDNYMYKKKNIINSLIKKNFFDHIIVNNNYMKKYIIKNTNYCENNIKVIYHHYDPYLSKSIIENQEKIKFGYIGSLASLSHNDNLLHLNLLKKRYKIEFLDSESGINKTEDIYLNKKIKSRQQIPFNNIKMKINFNCQISIRKLTDDLSKFKTTAKIATAAFFNHNIITTNEECIKDILPQDYPFILKQDDSDGFRRRDHASFVRVSLTPPMIPHKSTRSIDSMRRV